MDIEKELEEMDKKQDELDSILIVYNKHSAGMVYSISDILKSNKFIRNKVTNGKIKIEILENDLIVIYTDNYKSVKDSLEL